MGDLLKLVAFTCCSMHAVRSFSNLMTSNMQTVTAKLARTPPINTGADRLAASTRCEGD